MIPFPQLSFDSGNKSGSTPDSVGQKIAPRVLIKTSAAPAHPNRPSANAQVATAITTNCPTTVPIVTLRLLNLSAKNPPGIENNKKGTENNSGTISTNHKSRSSFVAAVSSTRKLTSHFKVLSLNAP